ncbi:MAG: hypothetical protein U9N55_08870 [candidate division Zixibacteria bacterium]|nr:hypothetical protein [candidate division Zixibacteria bacterium]
MKNTVVVLISVILAVSITVSSGINNPDVFELIKADLGQAVCVRFEILTTIESTVFDVVDSAKGLAVIAADGRFNVIIGQDQYIYDSKHLFSYSKINNQVIVETPTDSETVMGDISFITNIDEWYHTRVVMRNKQYRLVRKDSLSSDIPDSMTVYVSESSKNIDSLIFFDINDDRNVIYFSSQNLSDTCDEQLFVPSFPDSTDIVRF